VVFELADAFGDAAHYMGDAERVRNPGQFTFTWVPSNSQDVFANRALTGGGISVTQLPKYGVGTTGDYWLRDLAARTPNKDATIHADSGERADRSVKAHSAHSIAVDGPGPGIASQLTWTRGKKSATRPVITLGLANVKAVTVLLRAAGFSSGQHGTLRVITDGPTTLRIGGRVLHLPKGRSTVHFTA
jgi:hypothetical protein